MSDAQVGRLKTLLGHFCYCCCFFVVVVVVASVLSYLWHLVEALNIVISKEIGPRCFITCSHPMLHFYGDHSFITFSKIFRKINISYPLIRTRTLRNAIFLENFANVLSKRSLLLCPGMLV